MEPIQHAKSKKGNTRVPIWVIIPAVLIGLCLLAFLLWATFYYHAGSAAVSAMQTDVSGPNASVRVEETDTGSSPSEKP